VAPWPKGGQWAGLKGWRPRSPKKEDKRRRMDGRGWADDEDDQRWKMIGGPLSSGSLSEPLVKMLLLAFLQAVLLDRLEYTFFCKCISC
jgi:hypothetical protein